MSKAVDLSALATKGRVLLGGVLVLFATSALAASIGTVTNLSGPLVAKKENGDIVILALQSQIDAGDLLITEKSAYARIKFTDGSEITLRPNSEFKVEKYVYAPDNPKADNFAVSLVKGGLRAISGLIGKRSSPESYSLKTPTATIGIRGTAYGALVCNNDCTQVREGLTLENGLHIDVLEGVIVLSNSAGQTAFSAGQFGYVKDVFSPPVPVSKEHGVRVPVPDNISNSRNPLTGGSGGCAVR